MFKLNKSIFQTQFNNSIYPNKKSMWSCENSLTEQPLMMGFNQILSYYPS